jgi:hypothetical protein
VAAEPDGASPDAGDAGDAGDAAGAAALPLPAAAAGPVGGGAGGAVAVGEGDDWARLGEAAAQSASPLTATRTRDDSGSRKVAEHAERL